MAVAVVELLAVGSQSSSVGVAVAVLGVLVLDVRGFDVVEAVFDGVELAVAVVDDDVGNWPPGGPVEVVDAVFDVLLEPSVGSQSSGPGYAVVEVTPVVEDVKN